MPKKPQSENKAHVSNLLQIYKNRLKPPQASVEKEVINCIETVVGIKLEPTQIKYTVASRTISLQVPSILKTEIKASEDEIKHCLKQSLPPDSIPTVVL